MMISTFQYSLQLGDNADGNRAGISEVADCEDDDEDVGISQLAPLTALSSISIYRRFISISTASKSRPQL